MKSIFLMTAAAVLLLSACQGDTLTGVSADDQALVSSQIQNSPAPDPTNPGSGTEEFGRKHRPGGRDSLITKVAIEDLPASITDYITLNYPDATIDRAFKKSTGEFIVLIKTVDGEIKIIEFDGNGAFVKELERKKHGPNGPKDHRKKLNEVDPTTLPAAITDYIAANYAGATIKKAGTTRGGDYIVALDLNGALKVLLFDASGNFVKELK